MNKYKIIITYDGTDFEGWQSQPHKRTICDALIKAFKGIFKEEITLLGASRTDSGVHAFGQVATFKFGNNNIPMEKILVAWNEALPQSIQILSIDKVDDSFHPLKNVSQKTYVYNLFLEKPLPFSARYGWYYDMIHFVDFKKFEEALQLYVGEHDFRSFSRLDEDKDTIRIVDSIELKALRNEGILQVIVKGKSFLHFQIRRMIGYALDVARRDDLDVNYIKKLLDNPEPRQTLLRAAAKGLFLRKITYKG